MNLTTKFINLLARHKEITRKTILNADERMNLMAKFINLLVKRMNVTGMIINQTPKRLNLPGVTPRHETLLLNIIKIYLQHKISRKKNAYLKKR